MRFPQDSSAVLPKLAKGLIIVTLTLTLGAHWALLQSLAWAGMLYSYSKQVGFEQAVSMTFDGDHPCALCQTIQKGKAAEQKERKRGVAPSNELKLDLPPLEFVFAHPPHPPCTWLTNPVPATGSQTPELPPPRIG